MYLFLFIFAATLSVLYFDKERLVIVFYMLIALLVLFAGTRTADVSFDYDNYQYCFNTAINENYSDFFMQTGTELSAFIIPKFVHLFFYSEDDYIGITFVIFAFFGVYTKLKALQKADYFFLGVLLYVSNLYFGQEMITIRAGVASGIFLLSIEDIFNKNDRRFFFKIFFAFLFHYSSILFIVIWAIIRFKVPLKSFFSALIISIVIAIFKLNVLTLLLINKIFPKVQLYLDMQDLAGGDKVNVFNFMAIFAILITVFFLFFINKLKDNYRFEVLYKIHIFSLIIFFSLSPVNMVFSLRSFELLSVIQLFLYPMIITVIPQKLKFIGFFTIVSFSILQFYYFIQYSNLFSTYSSWIF